MGLSRDTDISPKYRSLRANSNAPSLSRAEPFAYQSCDVTDNLTDT